VWLGLRSSGDGGGGAGGGDGGDTHSHAPHKPNKQTNDPPPNKNQKPKRLVVWWFGISVLGHLWIWPLTLVVLLLAPAWCSTVIAL
jgi:hypothetical protein